MKRNCEKCNWYDEDNGMCLEHLIMLVSPADPFGNGDACVSHSDAVPGAVQEVLIGAKFITVTSCRKCRRDRENETFSVCPDCASDDVSFCLVALDELEGFRRFLEAKND